jgi:hypothetical protein
MKPILNLSCGVEGRAEMLCLSNRGFEVEGESNEESPLREARRDESKRRERSLRVTRRGRSLDDCSRLYRTG